MLLSQDTCGGTSYSEVLRHDCSASFLRHLLCLASWTPHFWFSAISLLNHQQSPLWLLFQTTNDRVSLNTWPKFISSFYELQAGMSTYMFESLLDYSGYFRVNMTKVNLFSCPSSLGFVPCLVFPSSVNGPHLLRSKS